MNIKRMWDLFWFGADAVQDEMNKLDPYERVVMGTTPIKPRADYLDQAIIVSRGRLASKVIDKIVEAVESKPPKQRRIGLKEINEICEECGYDRTN